MHHRTMKNGEAVSYLHKVWCIHNDFVAENGVGIQQRSIRGFLQKCLDFYPKQVLESGSQTTQGSNYISFRR